MPKGAARHDRVERAIRRDGGGPTWMKRKTDKTPLQDGGTTDPSSHAVVGLSPPDAGEDEILPSETETGSLAIETPHMAPSSDEFATYEELQRGEHSSPDRTGLRDSVVQNLVKGLRQRRPAAMVQRSSSDGAEAAVHHGFHNPVRGEDTPEPAPSVMVSPSLEGQLEELLGGEASPGRPTPQEYEPRSAGRDDTTRADAVRSKHSRPLALSATAVLLALTAAAGAYVAFRGTRESPETPPVPATSSVAPVVPSPGSTPASSVPADTASQRSAPAAPSSAVPTARAAVPRRPAPSQVREPAPPPAQPAVSARLAPRPVSFGTSYE
jgi:hypothetical protein